MTRDYVPVPGDLLMFDAQRCRPWILGTNVPYNELIEQESFVLVISRQTPSPYKMDSDDHSVEFLTAQGEDGSSNSWLQRRTSVAYDVVNEEENDDGSFMGEL